MNAARRAFLRRLPAALSLGLGLVGCGRDPAAGPAPATRALRIAMVPNQDAAERHHDAFRALHAYLAPRLELPVSIHAMENVSAAIEGLRARKLEVCNFSPWPYLIAERVAAVEPFVYTRLADGSTVSYRGILVTRPATGLRSMADVQARAGELIFSFEEAVSTSGHLAPRAYFHTIGLDPERDFKRLLYGNGDALTLLAVKAGRLDVAASSDSSLRRALARGVLAPDELTVLWRSEPLLSGITAVRAELPAAFKQRLRDLYVDFPAAAPDLWATFAAHFSHPVVGYQAADSALLDPYRELITRVPGLELVG
jgi:phosphonate transport system substrate-binding protein